MHVHIEGQCAGEDSKYFDIPIMLPIPAERITSPAQGFEAVTVSVTLKLRCLFLFRVAVSPQEVEMWVQSADMRTHYQHTYALNRNDLPLPF